MRVDKITTKKLNEIYTRWREHSLATTDNGGDYQDYIPEIEAELNRRHAKNSERELKTQLINFEVAERMRLGIRACATCGKDYPLAAIDLFFSKVSGAPHRYRSACKPCQAQAQRERRERAAIENMPF